MIFPTWSPSGGSNRITGGNVGGIGSGRKSITCQSGEGSGAGGMGGGVRVWVRYKVHLTALSLWDGKNSRNFLKGMVLPKVKG